MAGRPSPLMLAPLVFIALAAIFFFGLGREDPDALPSTLIGRPAPSIAAAPLGALPPPTDEMLREPGVKLVNFWASWCAPCRVEHPNLEALAAEGIPIYGINYKDKPANALGFLDELGNPYTATGADAAGRMAIEWGVYGVPETYVIDGAGKIVYRFAGPVTQRALADRLRPAMEAAAGN